MDIKKILAHMKTYFYLYLISFIVILISFSLIINVTSTPNKNERVSLFILSRSSDSTLVDNYLNEIKPTYLEIVNVYSYSETDEYLEEAFLTSGVQLSDAFILPETFINEDEYDNNFMILDSEYINNYCNYEFEYLNYNEKCFGIKLFSKDTKEGLLKDYIKYDDKDYYLFINPSTYQASNPRNGIYDILKEILNSEK